MEKNNSKPEADILIEAMADVFNLSTTGFEEFYKQADKKTSGTYSQSASSGNYSQSASSGDYSKSASSGDYSKSASSGDYSKSASSGTASKSASSGTYSKSASSGTASKSASSGTYSQSASSGNYSQSASSGDYSQSASSGTYSKSASSGTASKSASSGTYSKSASSGDYSKSASSGDCSACSALGHRAAVKGDMGNLLMVSEYARKDGRYVPVGGKVGIVDGKNIKPNCWYIVERGEWVEVDFTDNIFSYVLSNKNGVLKVKTGDGRVLYVVRDEYGNSAHGETIEAARKDLIYKVVSNFNGEVPNSATGKEWISIYRSITGACGAGVRMFVEQQKVDLDAEYTVRQVVEMVRGQYGHQTFRDKATILKEQDGE